MHRFRLSQHLVWTVGVLGLGLVLMACTESLPPFPNDGAVVDGAADVTAYDDQQTDQSVGETSVTDGKVVKDGLPTDSPVGSETLPAVDVRRPDGIVAHDLPRPTNDLTPAHDLGVLKAKCLKLDADYVQAVAKAKSCSSIIPMMQCTKKVKAKLICPCQPIDTYITKSVTSVSLNKLKNQFDTMGCAKLFPCPKPACTTPTGAGCVAGMCVDKF
ncbi:MAG: hypothetical protein KAI47_03165 [Deltaproteobacteria bacterium]|nr:hypothetical protein [Deltaproteobacteria bacterium]